MAVRFYTLTPATWEESRDITGVYFIYGFFAADNTPLYIGRATVIYNRLHQHRKREFWREASEIRILHIGDLQQMIEVEKEWIIEAKPFYNRGYLMEEPAEYFVNLEK